MFDHSISYSYMLDDSYYPRMEPLSLNLKDFLQHIFLKWIWSFNLTKKMIIDYFIKKTYECQTKFNE
jgi:hypothetical protein